MPRKILIRVRPGETVMIDTVLLPDKPAIGTWPTPEEPVMAATWPAPEDKWDEILEVTEFLDKTVKPFETMKDLSDIIVDFRRRICLELEKSIRSDIGCLCKYNDPKINLCTEPKIRECLTRLVKTALLYQRLCCVAPLIERPET